MHCAQLNPKDKTKEEREQEEYEKKMYSLSVASTLGLDQPESTEESKLMKGEGIFLKTVKLTNVRFMAGRTSLDCGQQRSSVHRKHSFSL